MKVYEVDANDGEPQITFATKREAVAEARRAASEYTAPGCDATVDELIVCPMTKAAIVRLMNGEGGYVMERRTVFRLRSKVKKPAGDM